MNLFPYLWSAFGLVIGSFLNVCIYRLPRRESIVFPGSRCPKCGKAVRPYDNIPILSYLLLGGKCRFCRQPISAQYPLVEFLAGLSFYACAAIWGLTSPAFVNSLFLSLIIVLVFTDYHHQILPNALTFPGLILGLVLCPFQSPAFFRDPLAYSLAELISSSDAEALLPWVASFVGAVAGAGMPYLVAVVYQRIRKRRGLGMGDVKMLAMVGAFLGWRGAFLTIFAGSFLGSVAGILLIFFGGRTLQSKLPFGTFLGVAAAAALLFGHFIFQL
jgi:leader peptidase (prepilin peptidase) / N-methyltransferase